MPICSLPSMPEAGIEPARSFDHWGLGPTRLPLRHPGVIPPRGFEPPQSLVRSQVHSPLCYGGKTKSVGDEGVEPPQLACKASRLPLHQSPAPLSTDGAVLLHLRQVVADAFVQRERLARTALQGHRFSPAPGVPFLDGPALRTSIVLHRHGRPSFRGLRGS